VSMTKTVFDFVFAYFQYLIFRGLVNPSKQGLPLPLTSYHQCDLSLYSPKFVTSIWYEQTRQVDNLRVFSYTFAMNYGEHYSSENLR